MSGEGNARDETVKNYSCEKDFWDKRELLKNTGRVPAVVVRDKGRGNRAPTTTLGRHSVE